MAVKIVDECVGCPQGCINCGRKHVEVSVCDWCEEYAAEFYDIDGEEVCKDCAIDYIKENAESFLENFDKIRD